MIETPFRGTWRNTDASSRSVTTLAFEADRGRVHAWAGAIDLGAGPIEVFAGIAESTPLAFTATLSGAGQGEALLQGNINRGLMILATYQWRSSDSVLAGRFTREFLARRDVGFVPPAAIVEADASALEPASASVDPREFHGRWLTASDDGDVRSVVIEPSGPRLNVKVVGSGRRLPAQWPTGESWVFGCRDELGHETLVLLARFELPEGRSDLQIKVALGTMVVAGFHARNHGPSWFSREFLRLP